MNGPGLIVGNGKDRPGDQFLQLVLGDMHGTAGVHVRQLRVILGAFGGDIEMRVPGPDGHLVILVYHHGDGSLWQLPDDVAEQLGRQDTFSRFGHLRIDLIGNGRFHIVAGEVQADAGLAEDALQDGNGALLGHGPAGNVPARREHTFFTGETHTLPPFLLEI